MNVCRIAIGLLLCALSLLCSAASELHCVWEIHGKHNTVFLLGSIHVLRAQDYPLAPALQNAYENAKGLVMEINLGELDEAALQTDMLSAALLPDGMTLPQVMGRERYAHASELARAVGVDLSTFDQFAPWFAAEAISQTQLSQLGFEPQQGIEMYFLGRAQHDHKSIAGLETAHDQIALFKALSLDAQADYLVSSLSQAHDLPREVGAMVHAWQRGDSAWFEQEMHSEFGSDPALYDSLLTARNRKWLPKIEALLDADANYLVIVGTGHLVGPNSVIDLLRKAGISATQR